MSYSFIKYTTSRLSVMALLSGTAIGLACTLPAGSAKAGFEWTPPAQEQPSEPTRMPTPVEREQAMQDAPDQSFDDRFSLPQDMNPDADKQTGGDGSEMAGTDKETHQDMTGEQDTDTQKSQTTMSGPIDITGQSPSQSTVTTVADDGMNDGMDNDMDNDRGQSGGEVSLPPETAESDIQNIQDMPERRDAPESMTSPKPVEAITFNEVEGFGNDIPLALALRQIAPGDYKLSFDGVSPGASVSWSGGRGWDEILKDVMVDLGAQATIDDETISIARYDGMGDRLVLRHDDRDMPGMYVAGSDAEAADIDTDGPVALNEPVNGADDGPMSLDGTDMADSKDAMIDPAPARTVQETGAQIWTAAPGERVSDVLKDWTNRAGAQLFWNTSSSYTLTSALRYEGSLEGASNELLREATGGDDSIQSELYPNLPDGPEILLVRTVPKDSM